MEQLVKDLHQPSWWIGVVIVSLVVGIVSSYSRDLIDRVIRGIVGWNRSKSLSRKQRFEQAVTILSQNSDKRIYYSIKAVHWWVIGHNQMIMGLLLLCMGIIFISVSHIVSTHSIWSESIGGIMTLLGCCISIIGFSNLKLAADMRDTVDAAQYKSEEKENINLPL